MGVFPEPARCADDVGGRVPATPGGTRRDDDTAVTWLASRGGARSLKGGRQLRNGRSRNGTVGVVLGLVAGLGVPQATVAPVFIAQTFMAPAAQAHDRIATNPKAESAVAGRPAPDARAVLDALPLPEQDPPTTALIADDLASLPRLTQADGEDAIRFGPRSVPLKVVDTIVKTSQEAGVDPVYMMALADKESSFDTDAKASTSSAQGLFQFVRATWLELIRDYGSRYGLAEEAAAVKGSGPAIKVEGGMRERVLSLRNDPKVATQMAAELIKRDRDRIEARVGRPLSTAELYLAHFLGTASAGRFLSLFDERPDETAAKAFRSAAKANRSLFTQKDGGKRRHLTIAEFQSRIESMIDARLARYEGVQAASAAAATAVAAKEQPEAEPTLATAPKRIEVTEALPPDGA